MTEAQEREIYLLRRHFGISAHDAMHVLPAWEIDLLMSELEPELQELQPPHDQANEPAAEPARATSGWMQLPT